MNTYSYLKQSYEYVLARGGLDTPEDLTPSAAKISPVPDGYVITDISGIRVRIVSRLDGRGYDLTKRASACKLLVI